MELTGNYRCVEVNAPELFEQQDFLEWLNENAGKGLATWHFHQSGEPNEMSDVFFVYDHGEGDVYPNNPGAMPEKCWEAIHQLLQKEGIEYAIVRLINCV